MLTASQAPAGPTLRTKRKLCLPSYTLTPHLIMGQVFYSIDPSSKLPIHMCWPFDPWPIVCSAPYCTNYYIR